MHPDISIIIPIYNVEAFLNECLTSIANQQFDGVFEVLLINDKSTDNSKHICSQFVANYPALFFYHELPKNLGVSAARNAGLERLRGDYFCYVDADDILAPNAIQTLHTAALQYNVDIVKGNNIVFNTKKSIPANYRVKKLELYQNDAILTLLYNHAKVRGHTWGKLFRSEALKHYRFPAGIRMAEDLAYCVKVFSTANGLALIPNNVYQYRLRASGAAQNKYRNHSYRDWFEVLLTIGGYASTVSQKKAYYSLLVRSMLEFSRECRSFSGSHLKQLLDEVSRFSIDSEISFSQLILKHRVTIATLFRYIKYHRTHQALRKKVATTIATNSTL